jgi:hypothetical protein
MPWSDAAPVGGGGPLKRPVCASMVNGSAPSGSSSVSSSPKMPEVSSAAVMFEAGRTGVTGLVTR